MRRFLLFENLVAVMTLSLLLGASGRNSSMRGATAFFVSKKMPFRGAPSSFSCRKQLQGKTTIATTTTQRPLVQNSAAAASDSSTEDSPPSENPIPSDDIPIYICEGLFAVEKPLEWTSNDCVSYIRRILERDAKNRGAPVVNFRSRRNKSRKVKVGHGGTLDPLATGVLVIGVGKGTKELQTYLAGSKAYRAIGEFGFETTTLDMDPKGNVTRTGPVDHITLDAVKDVLPQFTGRIMQVPPIFSAIRKEGKRLYKLGQEGVAAEDIVIEAREVEILDLQVVESDEVLLPKFEIAMECGGGTYVRSLIRDIGYKLNSVATTTLLQRTKQSQFSLADCLEKENWTADNIYTEIEKRNRMRKSEMEECTNN